jgi:tetratricopeptide (TPR) repeat protein
MQWCRRILLGVGTALLGACSAHAGVYNPADGQEAATYPDFIYSPTGRNFREVLITLQSIPLQLPQIDNPVRRRYVFEEERILAAPNSLKTAEDRLQASAVLIRRGKYKEAEEILRPIATRQAELDNIPLQANFATALHLAGKLQDAHDTLRSVVQDHWKAPWQDVPDARKQEYARLGWTGEEVYQLYRDYDKAYLKLLRLRLREQLAKKTSKALVQPPDALFDDGKDPPTPVKFVDENGRFEAGRIANTEKAKLDRLRTEHHPSALATVQQLCVWLPHDMRLYWLLGELYNAEGGEQGIQAAYQIFKELSEMGPMTDDTRDQLKSRLGALMLAKEQIERKRNEDMLGGNKLAKLEDDGPPIDWRTVAVSFGAGFICALAAVWQVREILRRRQVRQVKEQSRSIS